MRMVGALNPNQRLPPSSLRYMVGDAGPTVFFTGNKKHVVPPCSLFPVDCSLLVKSTPGEGMVSLLAGLFVVKIPGRRPIGSSLQPAKTNEKDY